ncbi:hypothetical protein ACVIQW_005594 [Bradyrhizobium diazoefficiens]
MPSSAANHSAPGARDGIVDQLAIVRGRRAGREIGAIDREMQHVELERLPQAVGREVAGRVMPVGNACEQARQHDEFAGEQRLQHPPLGLLDVRRKPRWAIADLPPGLVQRLQPLGVDQHLRDDVHPLIAGGALDAGEMRQVLVLAQDLFDHGVERLGVALRVAHQPAQPLAVLGGIAQAVDVIEPDAVQPAVGHELLHQPVRGSECAGVLDAQAGEPVDVEEAAVVDVAGGEPPMTELVVLALQQMMQRQRLRRTILGRTIGGKAARDDVGRARDLLQLRLEARGFLAVGTAKAGVAGREREQALAGLRLGGIGFLHEHPQHFAIALRGDRQAMLEIPGRKAAFAGIVAQLDVAALQRLAIGRTEDRQQHAAAGAVGQQIPVDIEGGRVRRSRSPFQHVKPPGIVGKVHADMVRHEVDDEAEVVPAECLAQPRKAGLAAELRIELAVIDGVVAVRRALARLHHRRGIQMRDSERFEIRHHCGSLVEVEIRGELKPVGRERNGRRHVNLRGARPPTRAEGDRRPRRPRSACPHCQWK